MSKLATAIATIQAVARTPCARCHQPLYLCRCDCIGYNFWSLDGDLLEQHATNDPGWYAGVVAHFHGIHADEVRYEKTTT